MVFHDTIKLSDAAARFRSDLLAAKVDRSDLHAARTAERNPMRVHDLAEALRAATAANEWAVVSELARELAERRRARTSPGVPSLETARAKRTRQR